MAIEWGVSDAEGATASTLRVMFRPGEWIDVPRALPHTISYDQTRPYQSREPDNQGCPMGYVFQPILVDGVLTRTCRRADWGYMTNPDIGWNEQHAGPSFTDFLREAKAIIMDGLTLRGFFTEGVPQVLQFAQKVAQEAAATAGDIVKETIGPVLPVVTPALAWIAVGLVALWGLFSSRTR